MMRWILLPAVLVLCAAGCGGSSGRVLERYGVSIAVPSGWQAHVQRGAWFLSAGRREISVKLYEDTADSAWSPGLEASTYRPGRPSAFTAGELAIHHRMRNFRLAGRLFDLFVSRGPRRANRQQLTELNDIVRSIRVRPGDFYPGHVAPAGFRPAQGWIVRHQGSIAAGTDNFVVTVASTVPWLDPLNAPVEKTVPALRATRGVVVIVSLEADNRFPPAARPTRLRLGPVGQATHASGPVIAGLSTQGGAFVVAREYTVGVDVIYGSRHPSRRQRALAHAELARLLLPRWPRWS